MRHKEVTGKAPWVGDRGPVKEPESLPRRLVGIQQVAEYTGLAVKTIYSMVSQRRIPFVKLGRLTKFDIKEIDAWINRHTVRVRDTAA